jgi:hypothetical protein
MDIRLLQIRNETLRPKSIQARFHLPVACAAGLDSADALGYSGIDQDRLAGVLILFKGENDERGSQDRFRAYAGWRDARNDTKAAAFHATSIVSRLFVRRRQRRDIDLMLVRAMRSVVMRMRSRRGRPRRWCGLLCQTRLPRQSAGGKTDRQNPDKCLSQKHTHPQTLPENPGLHQGRPN